MDLRLGIRVVRFRANNARIMNASWSRDYIRTADVAKIGVVAKIVEVATARSAHDQAAMGPTKRGGR
jgi:hypothetical protein